MLNVAMSDVTQILQQIDAGDPYAAGQLLPLVYDELRRLAAARMARESPDHTLQPTALVHEAYVRLVKDSDQRWDDRGHFFAAAAEAMRRILVEGARRKGATKHGAEFSRVDLDKVLVSEGPGSVDLLSLDDALRELEQHDAQAAAIVKLRYFAGLSHVDAAAAMGVSRRAADRLWALARAWLFRRLGEESQ